MQGSVNVIIVCDFAVPSGGSQKVAIESARAMAEIGVPVEFVHAVPGTSAQLDHPLITCTCLGLSDVWDRPIAQAAIAGVWNRPAARRLAAIFAAPKPPKSTIIHIHQWTRAFSPSVFQAALASPHAVVVTAHDYFLSCPNGVYYRFEQERPCGLRPLSAACLLARCDPKTPAHKAIRVMRSIATAAAFAGKSFDIVHVSDRGRDTLAPLLSKRLRHHRIDNPVDVSKAAAATIAPDARFAVIGRLTREKGAVVAAEAAAIAGAPIVFIGDGPAEPEIRSVNPGAEILGWQSPDEIARLLRGGIKAVVAASQWLETGPLTVYEAAAAGVAAIASNRCGAAERVLAGTSGFVVEPVATDIADAMRRLQDHAVALTLGAAAYGAYWAAPPTPQSHAMQLIALYREILGSGA